MVPAAVAAIAGFSATSAVAAPHVYVSTFSSSYRIDVFNIGPSGALSPTSFVSSDGGATSPWYMAMTNNAHHFYDITFAGRTIEASDVAGDGGLFKKNAAQGGEAATGTNPYGIALSPDNRNAYVPNENPSGQGTVSIYDIAADGKIKPHSPATIDIGTGATRPDGIAVSRDGKSVYVASESSTIYEYDRILGGSLKAKSVGSVSSGTGSTPVWLVLTPDGKHLYSSDYSGGVEVFDVGLGGKLTQKPAPLSPVSSGESLYQIAMSPSGKNLYAASNTDGMVYVYDVQSNGALKPKVAPNDAVPAGKYLTGITLTPSGRRAYAVDSNGGIAQFTVDALGRLHKITPPVVSPADPPPENAVVTPNRSPVAGFTFSHKRGLTKKFNATTSKDPDDKIALYKWTFGDGKSASLATSTASHKYAKPGEYRVSLTVVDNVGCSSALLWTGQMAYCSGNPAATLTQTVTVRKPKQKK